jgi:hypothetical protein
MLTLDNIRRQLADRKLQVVAYMSGLSYGTVRGVANGAISNPDYKTIVALSKYLEGDDQ